MKNALRLARIAPGHLPAWQPGWRDGEPRDRRRRRRRRGSGHLGRRSGCAGRPPCWSEARPIS